MNEPYVADLSAARHGVHGSEEGLSVKTNTFYDNDSGGDKNAKVSFVTPQNGTYLLLVTDYPGTSPGCYRYQVDVR